MQRSRLLTLRTLPHASPGMGVTNVASSVLNSLLSKYTIDPEDA